MAVIDPIDFGHFPLGSLATLTFIFKVSGTPGNPGAAFCNLTPPGSVKTPQTLSAQGAGVYTLSVNCNPPGVWTGSVYSTGTGQTAQPFEFTVDPDPNFGP